MDKEILKLFPQKAFKLLSIKDSLRIGAQVTKSLIDTEARQNLILARQKNWKWNDIDFSKEDSSQETLSLTKEMGEKILKIYFSQFFEEDLAVHLDFGARSFYSNQKLVWIPSRLHYQFSKPFLKGVQSLYKGFYFDQPVDFENGLKLLGIIKTGMSEEKKQKVINLFLNHFGEGKVNPVQFSSESLQKSFNAIFSFFLQEDIELNPEFAVLGINLVTLYLTLEEIPFALNVREAFLEVVEVKN